MLFGVPRETINPLNSNLNDGAFLSTIGSLLHSRTSLDIESVYLLWMQATSRLLDLVMPRSDLVYQQSVAANLSTFSISFGGSGSS